MNDPHVAALLYNVEHKPSVDYQPTARLAHEEAKFRVTITHKEVRFELKDHHATEESARRVVDQYIRLWEFSAGIANGPGTFTLKFKKAEIVDRKPTPGVIEPTAVGWHFTAGSCVITISRPDYPPTPSGIELSPNVQTMYDRLMNYRAEKEPLPSVANFCLTVLEHEASHLGQREKESRRQAAARIYSIDFAVLDKIGNLTANKGGPTAARKADGVHHNLTDREIRFLEKAVQKIILRAAQITHDGTAPLGQIALSDLQS